MPNELRAGIEIGKAKKLAVLYVGRALVVGYGTRRVEIALRVEPGIFVLAIRCSVATNAWARDVGHVIDHGVNVNPHPGNLAAIDHVGELPARSRPAPADAVAHRLIALAPRMAALHTVLLRRGYLNRSESRRPEHRLALARDVGPFPLEQVHEDVTRRHVAARAIRRRQCRARGRTIPYGARDGRPAPAAPGEREREKEIAAPAAL